ncbi:protein disulfide-isomerase-like [Aphis gossypii]|uniref:protein disulfide-isomerase-like n=1 Tax=Aphis gossypii TaxID=80765 RepID=UPI0021598A6B|nr:protein disulfide-isomerase-like [Aphis gossypii]
MQLSNAGKASDDTCNLVDKAPVLTDKFEIGGVRPHHRSYARAANSCQQQNPKRTVPPPKKLKFVDAPWCGYCKQLAPEYESAAQHLAQNELSVKLGKVDATIERDLAEQFGIRAYPTLKLFKNGKPIDYTGGRTKDKIIQWVTMKSDPTKNVLKSEEELKSFIKSKNVTIVGFFENFDSDAEKFFLKLADSPYNYRVGLVTDYSKFSDLEHKDKFVVYKKFGEKKLVLDGDISKIEDKLSIFLFSLFSFVRFRPDLCSEYDKQSLSSFRDANVCHIRQHSQKKPSEPSEKNI